PRQRSGRAGPVRRRLPGACRHRPQGPDRLLRRDRFDGELGGRGVDPAQPLALGRRGIAEGCTRVTFRDMSPEHVDVLIVGAGLSGVGAGYHLQTRCPGKTYAIFESRADLGGTWDLFRYPGIRSDSDMYTLGYRFKPWETAKA